MVSYYSSLTVSIPSLQCNMVIGFMRYDKAIPKKQKLEWKLESQISSTRIVKKKIKEEQGIVVNMKELTEKYRAQSTMNSMTIIEYIKFLE